MFNSNKNCQPIRQLFPPSSVFNHLSLALPLHLHQIQFPRIWGLLSDVSSLLSQSFLVSASGPFYPFFRTHLPCQLSGNAASQCLIMLHTWCYDMVVPWRFIQILVLSTNLIGKIWLLPMTGLIRLIGTLILVSVKKPNCPTNKLRFQSSLSEVITCPHLLNALPYF